KDLEEPREHDASKNDTLPCARHLQLRLPCRASGPRCQFSSQGSLPSETGDTGDTRDMTSVSSGFSAGICWSLLSPVSAETGDRPGTEPGTGPPRSALSRR